MLPSDTGKECRSFPLSFTSTSDEATLWMLPSFEGLAVRRPLLPVRIWRWLRRLLSRHMSPPALSLS